MTINCRKSTYTSEETQEGMAHTDVAMTKHYQSDHEIEWTDANLVLTPDISGGLFKK